MDENLLPELFGEILFQTSPTGIVTLYNTSLNLKKRLEDRSVLSDLGKRFGWHLETFNDFIDAYYTSFFTPDCYKYFNYEKSMEWALESGDLKAADQLFEYYRFRSDQSDILESHSQYEISAAGSIEPFKTLEWFYQKMVPYGFEKVQQFMRNI
ncbi:Hypothetical protein POVR1_LOCUS477 [uncultured virus]|nr:Hypothetical protein POVR1_LOCUS477 [uncultured virus]